ncbi:haloacid dehalogenase-like hydrolase domain-containing 5 [Latimeria chalumnae]|uniref:Haloacid dehalogenase-like hydrolase domain-containing 5 n=1 Tax=Latimeria chalumnae TaxID=7897 RepID=H3B5F5_LATCH|nr:PREDICTED: cat eye syndrome critical region protein 5 homolog [Latimeria chalumnae]|eukprot:XP_005993737.1 PREDICTED: cat eye syndrome critical region protein 5 homolog [Latimeria chalumnae]
MAALRCSLKLLKASSCVPRSPAGCRQWLGLWDKDTPGCKVRFSTSAVRYQKQPTFGLLFDIDGVLIRGQTRIPAAKEALQKLVDGTGKFQVPVVFVTNAGNCVRQNKAQQLSELLEVEVCQDQVILSHSPLRMFRHFHDKRVLVSGQGPIEQIARNLGFQHIITIEMLREAFPLLDMVDHSRRPKVIPPQRLDFPRIEAVILFGEPIRWETNLQLIMDVVLTNGEPGSTVTSLAYPHIPILACNMDLVWMAEAKIPRFGHGTFLVCLENIYKKLTGKDLKYEALIGKPSLITYNYAEFLVRQQAKTRGWTAPIRNLYAIGDNPMADIYGANLYNRYLLTARTSQVQAQVKGGKVVKTLNEDFFELGSPGVKGEENEFGGALAESCKSILVCTGVYSEHGEVPSNPNESVTETVFHGHRDFRFDPRLVEAAFVCQDVNDAVDLVFREENWLSEWGGGLKGNDDS